MDEAGRMTPCDKVVASRMKVVFLAPHKLPIMLTLGQIAAIVTYCGAR